MRSLRLSANIVVSNLPNDTTAEELASFFDEFGLVVSARIHRPGRELGRPLRGWVDLAPAKSVDRAIQSVNGRIVRTCKLKVGVAPVRSAAPGARSRA